MKKKPEVVFELDGWTLERRDNHMITRHTCAQRSIWSEQAVRKVFVYVEADQNCWRCSEPIPEGIQAVYRLHEWDRL